MGTRRKVDPQPGGVSVQLPKWEAVDTQEVLESEFEGSVGEESSISDTGLIPRMLEEFI